MSRHEVLASVVGEGLFPIVYVALWPLRGGLSGQYHAVVVVGVDADSITILDPQSGESRLPRDDFHEAWAALRFLTIVISA